MKVERILICPLYWGIGHATRVQPIADMLVRKGHKVFIAAPQPLLDVFSTGKYEALIPLAGIKILYSKILPQYLAILIQLPVILISIFSDRYRISKLISKYDIDIIISDNHFAAWAKKKYTVYISHQLRVALPPILKSVEAFVSSLHHLIIKKYDECWIPDTPGNDNLSGRLSHSSGNPANSRYIGILSRMKDCSPQKPDAMPEGEYTALILSGPEPQRSVLEKIIMDRAKGFNEKLLIIAGKPDRDQIDDRDNNIVLYKYLDPPGLKYVILNSKYIICRSGYSTIMDLVCCGRSALLIPTPGQTEQEYLAAYMAEKGYFDTISQNELKGKGTISSLLSERIIDFDNGDEILESAIDRMIRASSPSRKQESPG